jgi:hypothetical protein
LILTSIENTSYQSETYQLWELIGKINSLTQENLQYVEMLQQELKKETSLGDVEVQSETDDAMTMRLRVNDVHLPNS